VNSSLPTSPSLAPAAHTLFYCGKQSAAICVVLLRLATKRLCPTGSLPSIKVSARLPDIDTQRAHHSPGPDLSGSRPPSWTRVKGSGPYRTRSLRRTDSGVGAAKTGTSVAQETDQKARRIRIVSVAQHLIFRLSPYTPGGDLVKRRTETGVRPAVLQSSRSGPLRSRSTVRTHSKSFKK